MRPLHLDSYGSISPVALVALVILAALVLLPLLIVDAVRGAWLRRALERLAA